MVEKGGKNLTLHKYPELEGSGIEQWQEHLHSTAVPEFDSQFWEHKWIEFVFGSSPCSWGFSSGPPVFLSAQTQIFPIPIQPGNTGQEEPPHGISTVKLSFPKGCTISYSFNTSQEYTIVKLFQGYQ